MTDHVPGPTLLEERDDADGVLSWRRVVEWVLQLSDVLVCLHARPTPYVLGTLHAESVVLHMGTDRPLIVDSGLCRRLEQDSYGHPGYVPFEQRLGREDPRSDIYALGALLHAQISDRDPDAEYRYLRRTGMDVQRTLRALYPPLEAHAQGIPGDLARVVARATAFSADDRYADAAALREALQAVRGPLAVQTIPLPEPSDEPVWTRLGMSQAGWYAQPLAERNRLLLDLKAHDAVQDT